MTANQFENFHNDMLCYQDNNSIFVIGDPVTYSVYPHVINGLGMATRQGILSVGTTYMDVIAAGLGDTCEWDALTLEVSHRARPIHPDFWYDAS